MKIKSLILMTAAASLLSLPAFAAGADGAALYKAKCAACHGADGAGQTAAGKSMKVRDLKAAEVQKQTDIELTKIIAGGKGKMPAYGKKMTEPEIAAVIAFIRTMK